MIIYILLAIVFYFFFLKKEDCADNSPITASCARKLMKNSIIKLTRFQHKLTNPNASEFDFQNSIEYEGALKEINRMESSSEQEMKQSYLALNPNIKTVGDLKMTLVDLENEYMAFFKNQMESNRAQPLPEAVEAVSQRIRYML